MRVRIVYCVCACSEEFVSRMTILLLSKYNLNIFVYVFVCSTIIG